MELKQIQQDREIAGAPIDDYSSEDRAFYAFWYGHMQDELMQPPLAGVSLSTARYIWNACRSDAYAIEDALRSVLPMAKGYAAAHPVGRNAEKIQEAESSLRAEPTHGLTSKQAWWAGYRAGRSLEKWETLRQALEVIAVGDSQNPQADATQALQDSGFWSSPEPVPVASGALPEGGSAA